MRDKENGIKRAMSNAKASLEIEGLTVTKEYEELVFERLKGTMSEEES
jgi:hypothetical protein